MRTAAVKGKLLLAVQLAAIAVLLLTGPWFAAHPWVWIELGGIAMLAWAVYTMRPHRVNPLPELRQDARLVTRGPYRWIRHPMYTGLLLAMLALVLDRLTLLRVVAWLLLLADLLTKLEYEEALLENRFPEYGAYRKRTKRLMPFVY